MKKYLNNKKDASSLIFKKILKLKKNNIKIVIYKNVW